ncbi:MAG: hypothetical protein N4A33_09365 [Bacteriovoracaceae bacterium]|jgi:hypothetical protein|nr:hypothetical protein [Bacteriovoracaceae bacterium]
MSRPVGLPKTGGRKKGSLNKKTRLLSDVLEDRGFDLVGRLLEVIPELDSNKQADILIKLLDYVYIKPRVLPEKTSEEDSLHSSLMNYLEKRKSLKKEA